MLKLKPEIIRTFGNHKENAVFSAEPAECHRDDACIELHLMDRYTLPDEMDRPVCQRDGQQRNVSVLHFHPRQREDERGEIYLTHFLSLSWSNI